MKNIYRVHDTYTGRMEFCLKKDLDDTINAIVGALKVKRMDYMALEPKDATLDDIEALNDYVSDNMEIETLTNEEELINLLNR